MSDREHDVIIVGGGVTGAACARDAALRGLDVLLLEKDDFASGTSSRSSKMIHGGLRYLETYQFKLVHEGVVERELALKLAPHLAHLTPHLYAIYDGDSYGLGMLNLALTFYDVFSGQWRGRRHRLLKKAQVLELEPHLNPKGLRGAGLYYDVLTDDARYTLDVLKGALAEGAVARNHTLVTGLLREGEQVVGVEAVAELTGQKLCFRAKQVVNATGPWTGHLAAAEYGQPAVKLKPSKGVHLVFDKARFPLQNVIFLRSPDDGRVTWPTPSLEADRVYVGTTDTEYTGDLDEVLPDEKDIYYLLRVANHTIPDAKLTEADIIGSWAGLRPLVAPAPGTLVGNASREHRVEVGPGGMITISGGKLTSSRVMGKHVIDQVMKSLQRSSVPYRANQIPIAGGDLTAIAQAEAELARSEVPPQMASKWLRHYGSNALRIKDYWQADIANRDIIGSRLLSVAEIRYNVAVELVQTLEDLMVRRTSLFFWEADGGLGSVDAITTLLAEMLSWSDETKSSQIAAYRELVAKHRPKGAIK